MSYIISKRFEFSASHQLRNLPEDHQCARLHGHNYIIEVVLASDFLNPVGFVRDYGDLAGIKQFIDDNLDHRHLNDVWPSINPTAEHLARLLYDEFKTVWPELLTVRVSETPKTWAAYQA